VYRQGRKTVKMAPSLRKGTEICVYSLRPHAIVYAISSLFSPSNGPDFGWVKILSHYGETMDEIVELTLCDL
jgi:hypothetical protein